jgi:hypothetical protein
MCGEFEVDWNVLIYGIDKRAYLNCGLSGSSSTTFDRRQKGREARRCLRCESRKIIPPGM